VARNAYTGPPVPFPLSRLVDRALGVGMEKAVEISNGPEWAKALVPSGNCVGTADDLSRFFEMLLRGGSSEGRFVLDRRTVRRATSETAFRQMDLTLGLPVRYGIGLMLGSEHVSVFGPGTPRAFGHLGFINCFGWADPDRDLSVALLTTGKPFLGAHIGPLLRLIGAISSGFPRRA
jgi:CubicO group peptidase (beta-lactamase class C family)